MLGNESNSRTHSDSAGNLISAVNIVVSVCRWVLESTLFVHWSAKADWTRHNSSWRPFRPAVHLLNLYRDKDAVSNSVFGVPKQAFWVLSNPYSSIVTGTCLVLTLQQMFWSSSH